MKTNQTKLTKDFNIKDPLSIDTFIKLAQPKKRKK